MSYLGKLFKEKVYSHRIVVWDLDDISKVKEVLKNHGIMFVYSTYSVPVLNDWVRFTCTNTEGASIVRELHENGVTKFTFES